MQEHGNGGVVEKLHEKFEGRDEQGEEVTEVSKEDDRQKQTNGT